MSETEPRVGRVYSCAEQYDMHGGSQRPTLPDRAGEVTLIRFRQEINPDGPGIIEHGDAPRIRERMEMLREQGDPLPVYKRVDDAKWEYLGRYRVGNITDDVRTTTARSKVCGWLPRYVMQLEEAG
jgi:hypothetical protein